MMTTATPHRRCQALWTASAFLALACSATGAAAQIDPSIKARALLAVAAPSSTAAAAPALAAGSPEAQLPEANGAEARGAEAERLQADSAAAKGALARFIATEYNTNHSLAWRIVNAAYEAGARYALSPSLVLAIISRESTFRPWVMSGYGAQGLMQVVPRFHMDKLQEARASTEQASLFHPETNIAVGTRILAEYIDAESSLQRALLKYSGKARRYIDKVLQERDAFDRVRREADENAAGQA